MVVVVSVVVVKGIVEVSTFVGFIPSAVVEGVTGEVGGRVWGVTEEVVEGFGNGPPEAFKI